MLTRALAALVVAVAGLLAAARPAHAHADLVATDPPIGSPLVQLPDELTLMFSAPVELGSASVRVLDAAGVDVVDGPLAQRTGDPTSVVVPVSTAVAGPVSVVWTLLGEDGHVMTGLVGYTVSGDPAAAAPAGTANTTLLAPEITTAADSTTAVAAPAADRTELGDRLASVGRALTYLALVLLLGLPAFHVSIWPAGASTGVARALHTGGVVAGLAGAGLGLGALAISLGAVDGWGAGLERALDTGPGRSFLVQLAVVLAAGAVLALVLREPIVRRPATLGLGALAGLALLWCQGTVGHAWATGGYAVVLHLVHVGAMSVWLGGLVGLLVVAVPAWSSRGVLRAEFRRHLASFSRLATWSVLALVWSGSALLFGEWFGRGGLAAGYWTVLGVKLAGVAAALVAARASHRWVRRRVGSEPRTRAAGAPAFTRRIATEIGITAGVLAATAVLAGVSPAP